ncbi:hypothetical protein SPI_03210 [Niveomyces insectorum RCEF 264]|uniref:Uncharacterized protein n=1 Tax=Niveomyces insectorum RCEF 264 TaxID=1081102 RepID=A0A167X5R6_9HYPO|nr:hypothetical protein SPI_03210 [Niveomyces insectorum RCEF 264]
MARETNPPKIPIQQVIRDRLEEHEAEVRRQTLGTEINERTETLEETLRLLRQAVDQITEAEEDMADLQQASTPGPAPAADPQDQRGSPAPGPV